MLSNSFAERTLGTLRADRSEKAQVAPLARRFVDLARKARCEGLLSLEEELAGIEDRDMRDLLTMVVDGYDGEAIDDIASLRASSRGCGFRLLALWLGARLLQGGVAPRSIALYLAEAFGQDADLLGDLAEPEAPAGSGAVDDGGEAEESVVSMPLEREPEGYNRLSVSDSELVAIANAEDSDRAVALIKDCGPVLGAAVFGTIVERAKKVSVIRGFYERIPLLVREQDDDAAACKETLEALLDSIPAAEYEAILAAAGSAGDADLAASLRRDRIVFGDLTRLSDLHLRRLLREVDAEQLARALVGADEAVAGRFLSAMSKNAAAIIREDMACLAGLGAGAQTAGRGALLRAARELVRSGDIARP